MTFTIMLGGIDLSIEAIASFTSVIVALALPSDVRAADVRAAIEKAGKELVRECEQDPERGFLPIGDHESGVGRPESVRLAFEPVSDIGIVASEHRQEARKRVGR